MTTKPQLAHEVFMHLAQTMHFQTYSETRQRVYGEKPISKFDLVDLPLPFLKFLISLKPSKQSSNCSEDEKPIETDSENSLVAKKANIARMRQMIAEKRAMQHA